MKLVVPFAATIVLASATAALAAPPSANKPQDLINLEAAWSKAVVARDAAALTRIVAPDWTGQNEHGKIMNRAAMIQHTVAGEERLTSTTNHDVHVRFIGGDHAIVQGMDNESGVSKGKKVDNVYSWTDVFAKRGGTWVAIASQNTLVK